MIAPSKFGHPERNVMGEKIPHNHVKAYAKLLDKFGTDRVFVLPTSAGRSVQFVFH